MLCEVLKLISQCFSNQQPLGMGTLKYVITHKAHENGK